MDKTEARGLTLEVWRYLRDHPVIDDKEALPEELWDKIKGIEAHCPLCAVLHSECRKCPLGQKNQHAVECHPDYAKWRHAGSEAERQQCAARIVELVEQSRFGVPE